MRRRRRWTLAGQLFALQLAIIAVVLVAVAAVSLAQSEATFERVEGRRVAALAEQVAASPLVRASLAETGTRTGLATLAQTLVTQTSVSSVSFAEPDLDVRVSTDPSLEGGRLPIGDPRVAAGASWSGTLELEGVEHLVSQVPVLGASEDDVGAHLGTVMVAERVPSTWERLQGTSSYLLTYLGIALVVGLVGSWLLSRRIKRQTRGMEPAEIAGPRRAPRGDAARHRRGRHRARPAAPDHAGQRGRPPAARPAGARHGDVDRRPAHRGPAARGARRREPARHPTDPTPTTTSPRRATRSSSAVGACSS